MIAIQIFSCISRSKGNQTIKFGQLTEYNMRNTFVEKSYTKKGWETTPRLFSKKLIIEPVSVSIVSKFYTVCFHCMLI